MGRLSVHRFAFCICLLLSLGGVSSALTGFESSANRDANPVSGASASDPNSFVIEAVRAMPLGGQYSTAQGAFDGLGRAISIGSQGLRLDPYYAQPSFCSGATYLVFLKALDRMGRQGLLSLDQDILKSLLVYPHQKDGQGVWGRWNANGPGTARLFAELGLGRNFTDFSEARPGDFMKIFWTNEIGQRERGHSVIYLGTNVVGGAEYIRFWSSNQATGQGDLSGYGEKIVPRSKIARAIFSRLQTPANIARARSASPTDTFLASLLTRRVNMEEVKQMCGL